VNKKCKECNSEVVFMDDSINDDSSSGFYLCPNCHEMFSIEEIEKEGKT